MKSCIAYSVTSSVGNVLASAWEAAAQCLQGFGFTQVIGAYASSVHVHLSRIY
jgi:hypothetical protein